MNHISRGLNDVDLRLAETASPDIVPVVRYSYNWIVVRVHSISERAGITQLKLAEEMPVSLQTVREWEKGAKFPHLRKLPRLAEVLGIEAGQLFPANGYSSFWPQSVSDAGYEQEALKAIETRLAFALIEIRKLVKTDRR